MARKVEVQRKCSKCSYVTDRLHNLIRHDGIHHSTKRPPPARPSSKKYGYEPIVPAIAAVVKPEPVAEDAIVDLNQTPSQKTKSVRLRFPTSGCTSNSVTKRNLARHLRRKRHVSQPHVESSEPGNNGNDEIVVASARKMPGLYSPCWNYFSEPDGNRICECSLCGVQIYCPGKPSHKLMVHLRNTHPTEHEQAYEAIRERFKKSKSCGYTKSGTATRRKGLAISKGKKKRVFSTAKPKSAKLASFLSSNPQRRSKRVVEQQQQQFVDLGEDEQETPATGALGIRRSTTALLNSIVTPRIHHSIGQSFSAIEMHREDDLEEPRDVFDYGNENRTNGDGGRNHGMTSAMVQYNNNLTALRGGLGDVTISFRSADEVEQFCRRFRAPDQGSTAENNNGTGHRQRNQWDSLEHLLLNSLQNQPVNKAEKLLKKMTEAVFGKQEADVAEQQQPISPHQVIPVENGDSASQNNGIAAVKLEHVERHRNNEQRVAALTDQVRVMVDWLSSMEQREAGRIVGNLMQMTS